MLTQLPRYVERTETASTDNPSSSETFTKDLKQVYVDNQQDFHTFKAVADYSNESDRKKRKIPFEQKLRNSQHILRQAYHLMHNSMISVSHGHQVPMDRLYALIKKVLDHLDRHSDSVLYLSREKRSSEYTYMRSVSFCILLLDFIRNIGFSERDMLHIGVGALLHDAGKMWVPQHILNKPGKLSRHEYREIREHIKFSELILYNNHVTHPLAQQVSLQHHERCDGSGYPYGLKQHDIADIGQIAAIIDVYDALTSNRCYKSPEEPTSALKYLLVHSKEKFNPQYVQRFVQHIGVYPIGSAVKLSNNIVGVVIGKGRDLLRPIVKAIYDDTTHHLIPPSRIALEDIENLHIVQTLTSSQLHFKPRRFIG